MTEKLYICEHAGRSYKCSECDHSKPHPWDASCNLFGCQHVEGENKCVECKYAEKCDMCSDVPSKELPAQTLETLRSSIKVLEAAKGNIIDAAYDIHAKLGILRTEYARLSK